MPAQEKSHRYTFPPFPTHPDGVTIIAFRDFEESGLQIEPDSNGLEVDGLGRPTVALLGKGHDTDKCKTKATGYLNKSAVRNHASQPKKLSRTNGTKLWHEIWHEESNAVPSYDSSTSEAERMSKICDDFKNRKWPTTDVGVRELYDKFIAFIGILDQSKPGASVDQEVSDDEDDEEEVKMIEVQPRKKFQSIDDMMAAAEYDPKEARLLDFIDNPAKYVKIFLSSRMRRLGLIWAYRNLENAPILLSLFLEYIIRSKAFPKPRHEREFKKALDVAELAKKELILTSKLAKALPDKFNASCVACFGPKVEGYHPSTEETPASMDVDIPPQSNDTWAEATSVSDAGWGSSGSGWDNDPTAPPATSVWDSTPDDFLMSINSLGPTMFPLTHAPGVVEWSVRRIQKIIPPSKVVNKYAILDDGAEPDPGVIESHLERSFTQVVLEPWTGWEDEVEKESARARILSSSNGPVIEETGMSGIVEVVQEESSDGRKPHNPSVDTITILVADDVVNDLSLGMGLGATWVQLARIGEDLEGKKRKKKNKSKSNKSGARFWYLEELVMTLPSFQTPDEEN